MAIKKKSSKSFMAQGKQVYLKTGVVYRGKICQLMQM
jgi:hypothetical protein